MILVNTDFISGKNPETIQITRCRRHHCYPLCDYATSAIMACAAEVMVYGTAVRFL